MPGEVSGAVPRCSRLFAAAPSWDHALPFPILCRPTARRLTDRLCRRGRIPLFHARWYGAAPMRFEHVLSPEELTELLDSLDSGLDSRPLPAVLDTACVRTGLHYQLRNGSPPASLTTAQDGKVRLFMEYDTLTETGKKLPKFARDLDVTVAEL